MKKNEQYIGVDEQYIPEEEKYVANDLNSEIKDDMHDIYRGAKKYITNKDNQEKMKKVGRKGLSIAKGVGIGYLALIGFVFVIVITVFILIFSQFFKVRKQSNTIIDTATNIIDKGINNIDDQYNKVDADDFNFDLEPYGGTQYGSTVSILLDSVITKIKKNTNRTITVIYNSTPTSEVNEIVALKKQFDISAQYEILFDYDSNGYINKITITDY